MKLTYILSEGLYDKLVGDVSRSVLKIVKTAITSETYKGIQIRREPISSLSTMFYSEPMGFDVGEFWDKKSSMEFDVELRFALTERGVKVGKVYMDGWVDTDDDDTQTIHIHIGIHPSDGIKILSKVQPLLRDLVRHEIEHLTQRGALVKVGKWMRNNNKLRDTINSNPAIAYKYFLLPDEVDANIHGLYAKAKTLKQPYQKVVDDYLDSLIDDGIIKGEQRKEIYNKWKSRIPKIGGIPKLR